MKQTKRSAARFIRSVTRFGENISLAVSMPKTKIGTSDGDDGTHCRLQLKVIVTLYPWECRLGRVCTVVKHGALVGLRRRALYGVVVVPEG